MLPARGPAAQRDLLDRQAVYVLNIEYSRAYSEVLGTYASLHSASMAAECDAQARPRILPKARKAVALEWRGELPTWSATGLAGVTYRIMCWPLEP